jgi:hypothetical protein
LNSADSGNRATRSVAASDSVSVAFSQSRVHGVPSCRHDRTQTVQLCSRRSDRQAEAQHRTGNKFSEVRRSIFGIEDPAISKQGIMF